MNGRFYHYPVPMGLPVPQEIHLGPQRGQMDRGCLLPLGFGSKSLIYSPFQPLITAQTVELLWIASSQVA